MDNQELSMTCLCNYRCRKSCRAGSGTSRCQGIPTYQGNNGSRRPKSMAFQVLLCRLDSLVVLVSNCVGMWNTVWTWLCAICWVPTTLLRKSCLEGLSYGDDSQHTQTRERSRYWSHLVVTIKGQRCAIAISLR